MKKVMPRRANVQRQCKADMKMQEELLGGREGGRCNSWIWEGVHLGGTEGTVGLFGLTRCH